MYARLLVAALFTLALSARLTADEIERVPSPADMEKAKAAADEDKKKDKPDFPPFEEAMKDYEIVKTAEPPFFTLWYNKKTDSLRAQLPASLIGPKFLIAMSMAGGPVATGFQLDHYLAYFERMDKNLVLMRVDPRYVEGGDQPVADVIKRSYGSDEILRSIPILTMKGGDPVIDLDGIFKGDFAGIGRWGLGSPNPQLSKWAKYKAFPQNVELTVDLAFMQTGRPGGGYFGGDGGTAGTGRRSLFHCSISQIPESAKGYKPRAADPRIGYFMTVRKDWTKKHDASTLFDRYITRWRLEKRDPEARLSAPKHPIIWYIEKTVPLQYRRWVKEGILEWNKAFEQCGFLDAIEVKQQEDYDPDTKDLDPEDVRYNFFRWIVTGRAFAMGPSRDHPLTGQIFDAAVVFDDSMVRHYVADYARLTGNEDAWGSASWEAYNPFVESFFRTHPQWQFRSPWQNLLPGVQLGHDPDAEFRLNLMKHMQQRGRPVCECAAGMAHQLQFACLALEAQGLARDDEDFIGQIVKEVVMHEIGHCLGLRHNFKASTWLPMEEIEKQREAGEANVGSVMDYNPPIIAPRGSEQGSFTTRSIGPYDYWAIEYGYRPVGEPYKSEDEMLKKIGARVAEAGLDYATDEDTMSFLSPDPLSNRFDMGRDIQEYARRQITLTDSLLDDITQWAVKDGESYTRLRRAFIRIMGERARVTDFVARFVGGQIMNRDKRGDPDARPPIQVVDGKEQRAALKFVCEKVFAEDAYQVSPKLLSHLAPGRFWHWGSDEFDIRMEFNIHDFVINSQYRCLFTLMNPFTIVRIHDNQVKFEEDQVVYTLAEHITDLTDAIWSELDDKDRTGTNARPYINSFRRNLQREHVNLLLELVLTKPGVLVPADANAIARLSAGKLSTRIGKVLKGSKLDVATEAHLSDVKTRIDKALDAQYTLGATGQGSMDMFWFFRGPSDRGATPEPVHVLPNR